MSDTNPSSNFAVNGTEAPPAPDDDATRSAETLALDWRGHELSEQLGAGGMGEVYRLRDPALERDLAVKVMRAELRADADAERRFLREARLTGALQHPGIVPIHNLGRLADGRLCYTMKLVRGQTLADILKDAASAAERLPSLLAIFEKVCQAVAYAHSKGVIHRDLKPSNVMVGKFGEVQVMDWGLAKVLSHDDDATKPEAVVQEVGTMIHTEPARTPAELSRTGAAMGTPSYMPPEQAMGERALVDERADVFALGAILCEALTGWPPYRGGNKEEVLRRARRGDLAEALGRLQQCGADTALLQLCRECLAAEREGRPRHAGVVAERVAAYQAEVQERLRRAELERAQAEVRSREERKRRRLWAALTAAVLLLLTAGGAAAWWRQRQIEKADMAVSNGLAQAELLAEQARAEPLQVDKYYQALEVARAAAKLAETGSAEARRRAETLAAQLEVEEQAAVKDRELLAALLDVYAPREGPKYKSDAKGMAMTAMAEPAADEQFAAAFRRWGVDVDGAEPGAAAALLKARPPQVVTEVIAALDQWASERRRQGKSKEQWQRLADLTALLDDDPGSKRRDLREILARGRLPLERALAVLSAALRPVPVPFEVPLEQDRMRLRQLAEQTDAAVEPILGLLTLVRALGAAGDEVRAEQVLRAAIRARPREVVLYHTLGQLLASWQPPRWGEAVECYQAARVASPDLGVNLATALLNSGRDREGLAVLARLVAESPNNPYLHFQQAYALYAKGRLDEAMAEYRRAIALDPKDAKAHNNLGLALHNKGQLEEAVAEYQKAIALDPKHATAHGAMGQALLQQGRYAAARESTRRALELLPPDARLRRIVQQQLQQCDRLLALDQKLPAILTGEMSPANAGEAVSFAQMCQQPYKKRYAASARLYADAFGTDPKLAADLKQQHRFNAACSAALAAAGQGEDARSLPDRVMAMFRRWALGWLRDDLAAYTKLAEKNDPKVNQSIQQTLAHWRRDPDLASVRDPLALDRLSDNERAAWQALWRDVDELAKRVAKQDKLGEGRANRQETKNAKKDSRK
jgi:serine/threonine-protein kinase